MGAEITKMNLKAQFNSWMSLFLECKAYGQCKLWLALLIILPPIRYLSRSYGSSDADIKTKGPTLSSEKRNIFC